MKNKFSHKGYRAAVEFSAEDQTFVGRVLDIDALILFSGDSVDELSQAFIASVDDYLAQCEADRLEPQKPCSGTFNVRVGADVHRRALSRARELCISLNEFVKVSVCEKLDTSDRGRRPAVADVESFIPSRRVVRGGIALPKAWEDQEAEATYGPETLITSTAHAEVRRH